MNRRTDTWIVGLAAAGIAAVWLAVIFVERRSVFDDAFISYRYAKNIAQGHGLTWNPGEPPVEGYTNFLLVVGLAPVIAAGGDPLWATRAASVLAALGTAGLLYGMARRHCGADGRVALLAALAFLPAGDGFLLSTTGLAVLIFTFFLFLAFRFAEPMLATGNLRATGAFGFFLFIAFLVRPEAPLLGLVAVALLIGRAASGLLRGQLVAVLSVLFAAALAPALAYLAWKWLHFGAILPNPFHIKVGEGGWIHPDGLVSVRRYALKMNVPIVLALLSLTLGPAARLARRLACLFALALAGFYINVRTLMDQYERFLYPLTPFLFFLALPAVCLLFRFLLEWRAPGPVKVAVFLLVGGLLFMPPPAGGAAVVLDALRGADRHDPQAPTQRERRMALDLARYPQIRAITIAWGDTGVIPYYTEARIIDLVGLNDRFIAKTSDLDALVDYFFEAEPTLVIQSSNPDFTRRHHGHGRLGSNLWRWASDPRWDAYAYVGTCITTGPLLHLHVRRSYEDFEGLARHVRAKVADVVYDEFPLPLGTRPGFSGAGPLSRTDASGSAEPCRVPVPGIPLPPGL